MNKLTLCLLLMPVITFAQTDPAMSQEQESAKQDKTNTDSGALCDQYAGYNFDFATGNPDKVNIIASNEADTEKAIIACQKAVKDYPDKERFQFQLGRSFYLEGDGKKALAEIKPLADKGRAAAEHYIGNFYADGEVYEQSYEEAAKWYAKAVEKDYVFSQYALAELYRCGCGVEESDEKAFALYLKAALQGDVESMEEVYDMYFEGVGVEQNYEESFKWIKKAADTGSVFAQGNVGFAYKEGKGVTQDYVEAVKWFKRALAQERDDYSLSQLGYMYEDGLGVKQSYTEAIKFYEEAIEVGENDMALNNLGLMYVNGNGVKQDYRKAKELFLRAIEQEEPHALENIGDLYKKGQGVEKSIKKALEWYKQAEEYDYDLCEKNAALLREDMNNESVYSEKQDETLTLHSLTEQIEGLQGALYMLNNPGQQDILPALFYLIVSPSINPVLVVN